METMTSKQKASQQYAKTVALFEEFITVGAAPADLRKIFTKLYVSYTRLLLKSEIDGIITIADNDTDDELYFLSELIRVLEGG